MIAGLLHTVPALAATFDALVADAVPGAQREHIVDAWMLETAIAEGVTPAVQARVASHLRHLQDAGADAVLVTCSSIGEAAEQAARSLRIPILRVDAPMAAQAVSLLPPLPPPAIDSGVFRPDTPSEGRTTQEPMASGRVVVLATNTATVGPTTRLIEREAAARGVDAAVTATVVAEAAAARATGDQERHDRLIAGAVRAAAEAGAGVIVLAQASMAAAAESAGVAIPVLTSPAGGVARLAEALTPSDPGRPDASANRPAAPGSGGTSHPTPTPTPTTAAENGAPT